MSEFWNASPPKEADIIAWCEREVETACLDMLANLRVWGHCDETGPLGVHPYISGDWGLDAPKESTRKMSELLQEAADSHISYPGDPEKWAIVGQTAVMFERELQEIEGVIAGIRKLLKPEMPEPE